MFICYMFYMCTVAVSIGVTVGVSVAVSFSYNYFSRVAEWLVVKNFNYFHLCIFLFHA